jgi:hypothetical protein
VKSSALQLALSVAILHPAFAQNVAIGGLLGADLSSNFQAFPPRSGPPYTDTQTLLAGGTLQWTFSAPLAIEADGLYRRLHAHIGPTSTFSVVTWEFPVLLNYRFSLPHATLLFEAGPSFRAAGNLNSIHPSHYGFTAGIGTEKQLGRFRLAPVLRYTHWAPDQEPSQSGVRTKPDELQLLLGFRVPSLSNTRPLGARLSLGFVLGTNLSSDYPTATTSGLDALKGPLANTPYSPELLSAHYIASSGSRSLIGGPSVSVGLSRHLAIQVQAIYRPVRSSLQALYADRSSLTLKDHRTSWEFPILAQYHRRLGRANPFIEAGPTFRLLQDVYGAMPYGVAAGAGVETRVGFFKITPGVRFTRWARPTPSLSTDPRQNEVAVLTGLSF